MGLGEIPAITQHLIGHLLPFLAQQADTNDT
jgi:hypothetical protein